MVIASSVAVFFVSSIFANAAFGFTPSLVAPARRENAFIDRNARLQLAAQPSSSSSRSDDTSRNRNDVQVYDSAFSPVACDVIHGLALFHSLASNSDTCIFSRPPFNETALTPLEHAMDSALTALNDTSKIVEYWSRYEYMNIDAHVDIDERELEEEGTIRYPEVAHILYLKVKEGLRGPTCVFPRKQVGWGLDGRSGAEVDLVTVPAVQGRILRFPGSAMHAVPCPAERWLLTDAEEKVLREDEMEEGEEYYDYEEELLNDYEDNDYEDNEFDDYEDDDEDEEEDTERSVLLFNTWSDEGPPPRGVKGGYETSFVGGFVGVDGPVADEEQQCIEGWESNYGVDAEYIRCNPISDWHEKLIRKEGDTVSLPVQESSDGLLARVNLMGEENRRQHPKNTARLYVPEHALRNALNEENVATQLCLVEEQ